MAKEIETTEQVKELEQKRDDLICSDLPINDILDQQQYYDNQIWKLKTIQQDGGINSKNQKVL